jgi:heat-inducible transcriptional repressor
MDVALSARAAEVLHAIVQAYIETGEPVASRTIARRRKDSLSSATIRNIMADLADLGYLDQPHTSAGRVPTAKAFRHYAQSAAAGRIVADELLRMRMELDKADTLEARAERTSHLLTELTKNVGIVAAIPTTNQMLDQIELLQLPDLRVLMIVVTRDQMVRNQVVKLDEPVTQLELQSIRNYVNTQFSGWPLGSIRRELRMRLEEENAAFDLLLRKLTLLYEKGLLDVGLAPHVFLEGTSNLVGFDLHLTKERLRDLFRALEEKKRLVELLDQFLAEGSGEVQVNVGLGHIHPAMRELTLVGLAVEMPGGSSAKVAVLGPMRMNYNRAMSAVLGLGQVLRGISQ